MISGLEAYTWGAAAYTGSGDRTDGAWVRRGQKTTGGPKQHGKRGKDSYWMERGKSCTTQDTNLYYRTVLHVQSKPLAQIS